MLTSEDLLDLQTRLSELDSLHSLRSLFADWNYDYDSDEAMILGEFKTDEFARQSVVGDPQIIARSNEFRVIYAKLAEWNKAIGSERLVISRLLNAYPFALWVFSDESQTRWHFVNVKRGGKEIEKDGATGKEIKRRHVLRRISLVKGRKPGRTICERLARLNLRQISPTLFGISELQIQASHDAAFDVESITQTFYEGYKQVARALLRHLNKESKNAEWAHEQALQTLNRLMFLRFVEHKETHGAHWLGDDPDFTLNFWKAYKVGNSKDQFYTQWLAPLFFEAFNNSFVAAKHKHFPDNVRDALVKAPYLNGGLFKRNDLDEKYAHTIPDSFFETLFDSFNGEKPGFFERYNFTIAEDSPFDQEVAVDPEMIGHVYESLISLAEIEGEETEDAVFDARGDHGIFYTQRVEIDLMGRLALYDYLLNHLAKQENKGQSTPALRDTLLEWVFAYDATEKNAADEMLAKAGLWDEVGALLKSIRICDPACGSGAFLVGMLSIVDDLQARANNALGVAETPYDRCRRIIADSLYGVDVMPWAVHVAELRLWLQLLIENDVHPEELNRHYPLLPNLSYKVRCGDSLVQELGGVTLGLGDSIQISSELRRELSTLKAKKRKYFQAQTGATVSQRDLDHDEKSFFAAVLLERKRALGNQIAEINKLKTARNLMGELPEAKQQKVWDAQIAQHESEIEGIERAGRELSKMERPPFVWSLSFAEVFGGDKTSGERRGFDIVIGNPPYVRQEKIAPPHSKNPTDKQKKDYKAALMKSVQEAWPKYFEGGKRKLDGKSDLYIYFYLHGLKLLHEDGAFAFITSNSWLDVGYGAELQEWLLRFGRVRFIFDNEVKRSFKSADVNTAIAILGRGALDEKKNAKNTARFLMWQVPFEDASNPLLWQEIESAKGRLHRAEFRLRPFAASNLIAAGSPDPQKPDEYSGNKWGGKYLRAPEIYDVILEKGKDKLVRLGDVADVRFGIKTGANEFFYLDEAKAREWGIEKKYLKPVIKSPRECRSIIVKAGDLKTLVFMCREEKKDLKGTNALAYIKAGEKNGWHELPSTVGRARWWDLGVRQFPNIVWVKSINDSHRQALIPFKAFVDQRLYEIVSSLPLQLNASLNSTPTILMKELEGRVNLGEGALDTTVYEAQNVMVFDPSLWPASVEEIHNEMSQRDIGSVANEIHQPDRRALDAIIFDALGLTSGERDAVYEATVNLVEKRLQKAGSLKAKE
jgi:hypothetical protein